MLPSTKSSNIFSVPSCLSMDCFSFAFAPFAKINNQIAKAKHAALARNEKQLGFPFFNFFFYFFYERAEAFI